jgi:hypothetical protein
MALDFCKMCNPLQHTFSGAARDSSLPCDGLVGLLERWVEAPSATSMASNLLSLALGDGIAVPVVDRGVCLQDFR